jgi:hypothetical protein
MITTYNNFIKHISDVRDLGNIYNNNIVQYPLLSDLLSDILRFQLVYAVSAFDRFIHEIVRIGIINSIKNNEPLTDKAKTFQISLDSVLDISQTQHPLSIQDSLILQLDKRIQERHKELAFQAPDKVSDALSHIWIENNKWEKVVGQMTIQFSATTLNDKEKELRQRLKLIVARRNQIVHEADIDLHTREKRQIDKVNIDDNINFIEDLGKSINICIIGNP